jgi:hypothetical protein
VDELEDKRRAVVFAHAVQQRHDVVPRVIT